MIRKMFRLINSLIITNIKLFLIKVFHFRKFSFNVIQIISPTIYIDIQNKGKIFLGKKLNIPFKCILGVRENGTLKIDNGTFINNNCQIIAHESIEIGKNVCIGPNTVIVDHNHCFDENGVDKKSFKSSKIKIGNNVWIGANCVILNGTTIGDNCVIGAGSVIKGEYDNHILIFQRKNTEVKKIKELV